MSKNVRTVEEYAADESFQNFVLGKSVPDVRSWKKKIKRNPEIKPATDEARMLVLLFSPQVSSEPKSRVGISRNLFLKIAASFLLLFAVSIIIRGQLRSEYPEIVKHAEGGNIELHLSDLTEVRLREGSTISYASSWEDSKERIVKLNGEAYFNVTKGKPFTVVLEKGSVQVLGTKFLVKSDSISTQVILEEGSVNFTASGKVFEMAEGDHLAYNVSKVSIQSDRNIDHYYSWSKNALAFNKEALEDVISTINNSYELHVELASSRLRKRKITTTIDQNDPLLLLEAIAAIYDIDMIHEAGKIIMK